MNVWRLESDSTKTVTIIYINTTFSTIIFIAYRTSANKTSHCHCFCNLSHNYNMLYNIVAFQSSPDIQNCIYQFCTILLFNFNFTTFIWPNTRSISALECGIGYTQYALSKTRQFCVWVFSEGISIQAYLSPTCYCVSNTLPTDNHQILPLVFNFPNDFTF